MKELSTQLLKIQTSLLNIDGFDINTYVRDMAYEVEQIKFFYNNVTKNQTGDPSTSYYKPKVKPHEHQIAYFNLTQGFPKELRGGHWCYIVKAMKSKFLVIPCTSVKETSPLIDPDLQLDIEISDFENERKTRLQFSDMRAIDNQRLYVAKGVYDVITERNTILNSCMEAVFC